MPEQQFQPSTAASMLMAEGLINASNMVNPESSEDKAQAPPESDLLPGENPEATQVQSAPVEPPPPAEQPVGAPTNPEAPVQRQEVVQSATRVIQPTPEPPKSVGNKWPDYNPNPVLHRPAPAVITEAQPYEDLRSAILASLNPKSFFPLTPMLKRHYGPRFNTQEAAKEVRILLASLHDTRQIVVNHNRHMQLARPHYPGADGKTQYWTLDKVQLEAQLANATPSGKPAK